MNCPNCSGHSSPDHFDGFCSIHCRISYWEHRISHRFTLAIVVTIALCLLVSVLLWWIWLGS